MFLYGCDVPRSLGVLLFEVFGHVFMSDVVLYEFMEFRKFHYF